MVTFYEIVYDLIEELYYLRDQAGSDRSIPHDVYKLLCSAIQDLTQAEILLRQDRK